MYYVASAHQELLQASHLILGVLWTFLPDTVHIRPAAHRESTGFYLGQHPPFEYTIRYIVDDVEYSADALFREDVPVIFHHVTPSGLRLNSRNRVRPSDGEATSIDMRERPRLQAPRRSMRLHGSHSGGGSSGER